ncbi:MAG: DUF4249 family protein, partial [Bacteroidia bacterium]
MKTINLLIASCILLLVVSCTQVIKVDVPSGSKLVVVDAFINNSSDTQKVRLTTTADYFSNAPTPALLGATVTLNDLNNAITYTFTPDGNGNYYYVPAVNDSMAQITHKYQLNISTNGNVYTALSTLNRTTVVDSILFRSTARDVDNQYPNDTTTPKRRFYPLLVAKDIAGAADYYWVKVYKNGVFYNQPNQMDFFQDAGFNGTDGYPFLAPVAFLQLTSSDNPIYRYDVCTITILSINKDTYGFLTQLNAQLTNAQSGLFAVTPQNVKTNIQQTSGTQKAIGWFNMGAIR